jgi:hypothetical protein
LQSAELLRANLALQNIGIDRGTTVGAGCGVAPWYSFRRQSGQKRRATDCYQVTKVA